MAGQKSKSLEFWQINLQHCKAASECLISDVGSNLQTPPVLLIQEPYLYRGQPKLNLINYNIYYKSKDNRSLIAAPRCLKAWSMDSLSDRDNTTILLEDNTKRQILIVSSYLDITNGDVIGNVLEKIIEFSRVEKIPIIIGMDSNSHSTLWGCDVNNSRGDKLEEWIIQSNLSIVNSGNEKTYVAPTGSSIIDITLISSEMLPLVKNWRVDLEHNFSDHRKIIYRVDFSAFIEINTRSYKSKTWTTDFKRILGSKTCGELPYIWNEEILDRELENLQAKILKALNVACPLKTVKIKPKPSNWWNQELKNLRKRAKLDYKTWHALQTDENYSIYKASRKAFYKQLKKCKTESWIEFCDSIQNTKSLSKISKSLTIPKNPPIGILKKDGDIAKNGLKSLEILMDCHFPDSVSIDNHKSDQVAQATNILHENIKNEDYLSYITIQKVKTSIKSFGWNKTSGPDGFKPIVLQNLTDECYERLTVLYRVSIALGYTPKSWCKSKVVFIPKQGKDCYDNPKSMRPISLTDFMFKALERINQWEANETFGTQDKLHKMQFAFRQNKSTEGALSKVVDKIESAITRSQYCLNIFMDIDGAFNNINTNSVLESMTDLEVPHFLVKWYKSYLENRIASASIQGATIQRKLTKGVPQGGVWSSSAWNISINKILKEFNKAPILVVGFADDLCISIAGIDANALVDLAQPVVNNIVKAGAALGLTFNDKKTEVVLFTRKTKGKPLKNIKVNNKPVEYSKGAKYLGVYLDDKLSFRKHIEEKINKCKKHLFALKSIIGKRWGTNPKLMKWAYVGIVRPKLTYACHLWYHKITKSMMEKLTKLNRLACLSIAPVHKSSPTAGLEVIYNLLPIDLFIEQTATKIHKRVQTQVVKQWPGMGNKLKDNGHLLEGSKILENLNICDILMDKTTTKHNWVNNFEVLDFEDFKNDSTESRNSTYCYTDGSNMNNNSGLGIHLRVTKSPHKDFFEYLGKSTSVFQAEITAITRACQKMIELKYERIVIRSDSQAALQAIKSTTVQSAIVKECIHSLNLLGEKNKVILQWIKAHVGHEGNEAADQNAKKGSETKTLGPEPFLPVPEAYINQKIKTKTVETWQNRWKNLNTCRQTKLWFKKISNKFEKFLKKGDRIETGKLVQFITGHCNLRRHQHFYNREINPNCRFCNLELETPWHIATECPSFINIRANIFHGRILHSLDWTPQLLLRFCKESNIWSMLDAQE